MSLKAFHVIFIIISSLLSIGLTYWGLNSFLQTSDFTNLIIGLIGFLMIPSLIVYVRYFLKKAKKIDVWS
ncbi:MAG: hypothetical protein O3A55_01975 [Bacteroidetes bacterium]|nr:hypothetical protein [Bacteroidota bacterium]